MALTPAQQTIIKAYIASDPMLNNQPSDGDGLGVIRDHLNAMSSPASPVWDSTAPVDSILDTIDRSKYTPVDAADGTAIYTNRILAAQTKLMLLDGLVQYRPSLNMEKANIRASLRDAVIQIPTGAGGAMTAAAGASGVAALTAGTKNCTVVQRLLLASTAVTTGTVTAGIIGFSGVVDSNDVDAARRS